MYEGPHPTRLTMVLNDVTARLASAGVAPRRMVTLEVAGRRTGRIASLPLVVADLGDERYLVSMLGERAAWVKNVRAAGGAATLRHGRREPVLLEEVPVGDRAPVLKRYLQLAPGARAHFPVGPDAPLMQFDAIAARFPVFHVAGR